jgi:hypothetical protein
MPISAVPALESKSNSDPIHILSLPPEILQHILYTATTPSFLQLILTCRDFFKLAGKSRAVLLHHLHQLPGLKLGLSDHLSVSTSNLFIIVRRRAANHLYGVNFSADRTDYAFRHVTLDANACVLAEGREYINMALALKESVKLRLYGGKCERKEIIESPYGDGRGRILKILQWGKEITVLYAWIGEDEDLLSGGTTSNDPLWKHNETIWRKLRRGRQLHLPSHHDPPSSTSSSLSRNALPSPSRRRNFTEEASPHSLPLKFHLLHYNAYSFSEPAFFNIPRYKDELFPVCVAIASRLKCAILWDREDSVGPTSEATVVLYTTQYVPRGKEGTYDAVQVWPPKKDSHRDRNKAATQPTPPPTIPRSMTFFDDGRRLALYAPGQIVPFEIFNGSISSSITNSILLGIPGNLWVIDRPFWGRHERYTEKVDRGDADGNDDQEQRYCQQIYLCLGTAIVKGLKIAGILRSQITKDPIHCKHSVDCDGMQHTKLNSKVVARLWGWKETLSTLPGMVAWSGWSGPVRFVAVADWDRIFIWVVAVAELAEEYEEDGTGDVHDIDNVSDFEVEGADGSGDGEVGEGEGAGKGKGKQKEKKKERVKVMGYYERVWDKNLQASVVELKPIVLRMENGGVVRKMVWSRHRDEVEIENEVEEYVDDDDDEEEGEEEEEEEEAEEEEEEVSIQISEDYSRSVDATIRSIVQADADSDSDAYAMEFGESPVDQGDLNFEPRRNVSIRSGLGSNETLSNDPTLAVADESVDIRKSKKLKDKRKIYPPGLRLEVLTDRGVSFWELGVWARGRRKKRWLDEFAI